MASLVVLLTVVAAYLYIEDGRAANLIHAVAQPEKLEEPQEASTSVSMSPTTVGLTSAPEVAPTTTAVPVITPINALLIGDSILAELRWFEQGIVSLQGFTYTLNAESCRRIGRDSCGGREDRTAESVVTVLNNMTQSFDVIVLLGGYHANTDTIHDEIAAFVEVASTMAAKVVIVNYKESLAYPAPGSDGTRSMYTDFNETLRTMEAEAALGNATIADWNLFSKEGSTWFRSDAMHPNIVGTLAMGWFISATLRDPVTVCGGSHSPRHHGPERIQGRQGTDTFDARRRANYPHA